jgi:transcriptional regulator with XRE-family HTH domain
MSLGKRIATLRAKKKLTQNELADLTGISRSRLSLYEIDKREPDADTIKQIAVFFGITTDYLLGITDDPTAPTETAKHTIHEAISDDKELLEFWTELEQRDDLKLLFKQTKTLPPVTIKRIIKYIKMVEDEETTKD